MATQVMNGLQLNVDRGPNWLFVKLQPKRRFKDDIPQIADRLWSIATRHFIYRVVLELDELPTMPAEMIEQLVMLHERLAQSEGSLRICGLTPQCAETLQENCTDVALPNYATRQAAVLGDDAVALQQKLHDMMCSSDDEAEAVSVSILDREPCLQ